MVVDQAFVLQTTDSNIIEIVQENVPILVVILVCDLVKTALAEILVEHLLRFECRVFSDLLFIWHEETVLAFFDALLFDKLLGTELAVEGFNSGFELCNSVHGVLVLVDIQDQIAR